MEALATVTYAAEKWLLSLDGHHRTYTDAEEALEEARRVLRSRGGGAIAVDGGPGVSAQVIRVEPIEGRVGGGMIAADVAALPTTYLEAGREIESFSDPVERDIGLATLRLEATYTLERLRASGPGLTEEEFAPLSTCVSGMRSSTGVEAAVDSIDEVSKQILEDVWTSLILTTLTGTVAVIAALMVGVFNAFTDVGTFIAGLVLGGWTAFIFSGRLVERVGPEVEKAMTESWAWASRLGRRTDGSMAAAREIQLRLWTACGSPLGICEPFSGKARSRAHLIVGCCWAAVFLAIAATGWGIVTGLLEALPQDNSGISTEPASRFPP